MSALCWETASETRSAGAAVGFFDAVPKSGVFHNLPGPLPKLSWENLSKISGN